jgi:LysM repeat protein
MLHTHRIKLIVVGTALLAILGLMGCAPEQISPTPGMIPSLELTLYNTPTLSQDVELTTPALVVSTATHSPSPTPFTYKIVKGDTMLGVALRYGITLEDLQEANPDVDPRFLSVGTNLIIPLEGNIPEIVSTPTPLAVQIGQLNCYPSADGGRWCALLVQNSHNRSVENLSAQVILLSQEGEQVAEGIAIAPLNILRKGEAIPLSIYFPGPFDQEIFPQAFLLTSLPVAEEDDRYLKLAVEVDQVELSPSGLQATLNGLLSLAKKSQPASRIWLAAVAYSARGEVVGLRKWEAGNNLEPGKNMPFEMTVFSMGPEINRVEVFAEARP